MRAMVEEEVAEVEKDVLDAIADRHHTIVKAVTIVQFMLRLRTQFKNLQVVEQRDTALKKIIRKDYRKIIKQLNLKSTKISQGLRIDDDKSIETVFIQGRYSYKAILLANPQTSSFAQLVLRNAHQENHLTSSNRTLVKISTSYLFTGGALSYLDKLKSPARPASVFNLKPFKRKWEKCLGGSGGYRQTQQVPGNNKHMTCLDLSIARHSQDNALAKDTQYPSKPGPCFSATTALVL